MDPIPLPIAAEEWDADRSRRHPARHAAQPHPARPVSDRSGCSTIAMLPSALVFDNPHFLRPCFGITPPHGVHLHTYAVDLARAPDGRWWVICGSHAGALGHRLRARKPPGERAHAAGCFGQCHVRRLARFFDVKRNALLAWRQPPRQSAHRAADAGAAQRNLFRTRLPGRAIWASRWWKARDLTVRDNASTSRRSAGLQPVDVIVRRLDDTFCDPLELRGDSLLGVPGLVQAVRSGNVAVANALGSGVVETPALMAFLPGTVPPSAGRRVADAFGGHVVVRPGSAAPLRARTSGRPGDQAGIPPLRAASGISGDR